MREEGTTWDRGGREGGRNGGRVPRRKTSERGGEPYTSAYDRRNKCKAGVPGPDSAIEDPLLYSRHRLKVSTAGTGNGQGGKKRFKDRTKPNGQTRDWLSLLPPVRSETKSVRENLTYP